jgi:hypothetical protein
MKNVFILAAAGLLALSAPAFAQNAGSAGATGTGTGLTGSNPGTGSATMNSAGKGMNGGANGMNGENNGMNEGRAAAPNKTNTPQDPANPAPSTVRGDQNGQGAAKQ